MWILFLTVIGLLVFMGFIGLQLAKVQRIPVEDDNEPTR